MKVSLTPEQVIVFGEISSSLREWCRKTGKTAKDINAIIGKTASYSAGYQWLNGKGAPNTYNRTLLVKATGIPEHKLMKRPLIGEVVTAPLPVKAYVNGKSAEVLSFTVNNSGEVRIKLDVTLPMSNAAPLFRLILDAGIVMEQPNGAICDD